jgi:hypothetical protein
VIVDGVERRIRDHRVELSARVRFERRSREPDRIWFATEGCDIESEDASAFIPALLATAMATGERLVIDAPVSSRLLDAVPVAVDRYRSMFTQLSPTEVTAERVPPTAEPGATACFFTRGVDSWYSVISEPSGIDALVYVPGFDAWLDEPGRARAVGACQAAADRIGVRLVVVETNLRDVLGRDLEWSIAHGGALAAVGLMLPGCSRVLIPASYGPGELHPWGSHAMLDPLFSTERVEIVHHGAATRVAKVRAIAESPWSDVALGSLTVCFDTPRDGNCGRCPKCAWTTVALHAVGALDRAPVFEQRLRLVDLARIRILGPGDLCRLRDMLDALGNSPADARLSAALRVGLLRRDVSDAGRQLLALARAARLALVRPGRRTGRA